jgi:hypothetical protein
VVLQQASSVISSFGNDIGRSSGKQAAYDNSVASMIGQIMGSDGSLSKDNLGFNGTSVGNSSVVVGGDNWNDTTSPESVGAAKKQAEEAASNSVSSNV